VPVLLSFGSRADHPQKSLPGDVAAKGVEAIPGPSRPEVADGPPAALSADMIAEEEWESRERNIWNLVK
jgi:hypothetical protein